MLAKGQPIAAESKHDPDVIYSILDEDGNVRPGSDAPVVPDADCLKLYRGLLQVRLIDDRYMKLQRQGRLGFYMQSTGEEACHFGPAYALRANDWVFPSYREIGVAFWRGYTVRDFTNQLYGNIEDPVKGRQMPVHHSAKWINFVSISSPVGTQIPQAVGTAYAAKISGKDDVALTYFGEGTSSTGEFHVGMNFAGVWKAPCIFFCRNNGWAISTSREKQTAATSFAIKALGYGMPGVRVDGNDLLALIAVTQDAVARARAGEGPTLIEGVTYRRGGHSSSDDPSVYRDPSEVAQWESNDPLERWRRYLVKRGLWTQQIHDQYAREITEEFTEALKVAESLGPPPLESMFEEIFSDNPWHIAEQKAECLNGPRAKTGHGGH
jgi:2-oxoisovalerate dehydrogenase E1 component alpha subunit